MVSQRTLRRKLYKKLKRKNRPRCPKCGRRMSLSLIQGDHDGWRLFKHCGGRMDAGFRHMTKLVLRDFEKGGYGLKPPNLPCGHWEELFWFGVPSLISSREGKHDKCLLDLANENPMSGYHRQTCRIRILQRSGQSEKSLLEQARDILAGIDVTDDLWPERQ